MSTLRVSNIEAKADVSSPTVDEKIKFTNSSGNVLFHLDGKTSGITTVGINTTGNTFTVNNTTGDVSFSGSVTSSGVSTFSSDVSIADKIVHIGDTDTAIRFPAADTITAETGGTERLRITSAGKMGLGTQSPSSLLSLRQTAASHQIVEISRPNSDVGCLFLGNDSDENALIAANNSALIFGKDFGGTFTEYARITSSGNIGIGTDNPGVAGVDILANSAAIRCREFGGSDARLVSGGSISYFGTYSNHDLQFLTNGSNAARIDTSGRLLVGTSSSAPSGTYSSAALIRTQGNSASSTNWGSINIARGQAATAPIYANSDIGAISFSDNAGQEFGTIRCMADATSGSGDYPGRLIFSTTADAASSPTERLRIDSTGNIGVGGAAAVVTNNGYNGATLHLYQTNSSSAGSAIRMTNGATGHTGADGFSLSYWSDSNCYFYNKENGDIIFGVNNVEEARVLSGGGITFNGDTAAANALDDYEEGTWTPTVTVGTVTAAGLYTKIGRVVHCSARIINFSNTTDSSMVGVNGIPFTDGPSHDRIVGTVNASFVGQSIDAVYLGSDRLNFYSTTNTGGDPLRYNEINSGAVISFTITYMTS